MYINWIIKKFESGKKITQDSFKNNRAEDEYK